MALVEIFLASHSRSYQASIQCWAILDPIPKRHLNAFRWWDDDGQYSAVFESSIPKSTKKNFVRVGPPSEKTFWMVA